MGKRNCAKIVKENHKGAHRCRKINGNSIGLVALRLGDFAHLCRQIPDPSATESLIHERRKQGFLIHSNGEIETGSLSTDPLDRRFRNGINMTNGI
jgi:hypothetical protein